MLNYLKDSLDDIFYFLSIFLLTIYIIHQYPETTIAQQAIGHTFGTATTLLRSKVNNG